MANSPPVIVNLSDAFFHDAAGGAARLAWDLARKQVQWGYRVFLVCIQLIPDAPEREDREGVTVLRCPPSRFPPPHPLNLWERIRHGREATRRIRIESGRLDVVHSHSPLLGIGAMQSDAALNALKIHSIHSPLVLEMRAGKQWEHRNNWKQTLLSSAAYFAAGRVESRCLALADRLTSDSSFTRQEIIRDYPRVVRSKTFSVLPGWVDPERFSIAGPTTDWQPELKRSPRRPVLLTIRALVPRNGLDMLIDAAARLKAEGLIFDLVIGGDGPLRLPLQEQVRSLALQDRVTLLGRMDDDRLPVLYRSCDLFVLPTRALECFGIIILEALASGKPVIATPVGSIPELLAPVYPEGLISEVSAAALADALGRHLRRPELESEAAKRREQFRRYVLQNYTLEIGTERFRRLYAAEGGPPVVAPRDGGIS